MKKYALFRDGEMVDERVYSSLQSARYDLFGFNILGIFYVWLGMPHRWVMRAGYEIKEIEQ